MSKLAIPQPPWVLPQPRYGVIRADPSTGEESDLATKEMSVLPNNDEPYFLALVASWCGHCRVKVDLINNINTIHALQKAKGQAHVIPRVEWIDADSASQGVPSSKAQRVIMDKLDAHTQSYPRWFLSLGRAKPLVEVPGEVLYAAATNQGMSALDSFYRKQAGLIA